MNTEAMQRERRLQLIGVSRSEIFVDCHDSPAGTGEKPDLLCGYGAIGKFLGLSAWQVERQDAPGNIPTFKVGRLTCARRSTLLLWLKASAKGGRA